MNGLLFAKGVTTLIWWLLMSLPALAFVGAWFAIAGNGGRVRYLLLAPVMTAAWMLATWQFRVRFGGWQFVDVTSMLLLLAYFFAMPLCAAWINPHRRSRHPV